ncbi:MAG: outer membrane beta-barrel protein [Cyclobacteriaceae bacterium]|nr:outer membrane beta-barrel protein [Cyclobacteriaceae bacterium]
MKHLLLVISLASLANITFGQENIGLIQGGYSVGNRSNGTQPTGYKINAAWEFQPMGDKWTMGGSIGWVKLSMTENNGSFSLSSLPICFVSRYMFGGEKFKAFVRGGLGTHVSTISYSGTLVAPSDQQWGMSGSLGGGAMFWMSEKMFLSAEYEWLWLSNAFANTGSIGTASAGFGFRF